MAGLVKVIVVARSRLFQEGLRLIISDARFTAHNATVSFADALALLKIKALQADLIIGDPAPTLDDEYRAIITLRHEFPTLKIVVLTGALTDPLIEQAPRPGVSLLLSEDLSADTLKQALDLVMNPNLEGDTSGDEADESDRAEPPNLSCRERQTLACLTRGMSNKLIARHLDISQETVKVHLRSLRRKLKVQNRTQAAIWAVQSAAEPARLAIVPGPRSNSERAEPRFAQAVL